MKNILLIVICFISLQLSAQGNLQFNQVVTESFGPVTVSTGTGIFTQAITVPVGKVWKIEHASIWEDAGSYRATVGGFYSLFVDNICLVNQASTQSGLTSTSNNFPVWLSEGTYGIKVSNQDGPKSLVASISVIEFNVVP